jgi:hypothetical protein
MANISQEAPTPGTLVFWEDFYIGEDKGYHLVHVSPTGIILVAGIKDVEAWKKLAGTANASPHAAGTILSQVPGSVRFDPEEIAKVTYARELSQLILFDQQQKRTKIPSGKGQADVFAAIQQHLGGAESQEEADAWSVVKGWLFGLVVFDGLGGFMIYYTTICDPNYVATGRKRGIENLLNQLGYAIGPFWMSVVVGTFVTFVLVLMVRQLIKRPIRRVLDYSN